MSLSEGGLIRTAIAVLWLGWLLSWVLASRWSAPTVKQPRRGAQLSNLLITIIGAVLIGANLQFAPALHRRLYELSLAGAWSLVGLIAIGLAISWWARLYLGRMWSASITQKEGHRIIDTGPYGIVRHPIYTGVLISLYATAAVRGSVFAFIGAALLTLGFYLKAQLEERFLSQDLGAAYDAYRKRVPMLVPFIGV